MQPKIASEPKFRWKPQPCSAASRHIDVRRLRLADSRSRRKVTARPGTCFLAISTNGSLSPFRYWRITKTVQHFVRSGL